MAGKTIVKFRLLRDDPTPPSPDGSAYRFGLQDNKEALHDGVLRDDGKLAFNFELRVAADAEEAQPPVFTGPFAFGKPQDRFVYLSWQRSDDAADAPGTPGYVNRIKARLADIDWALLHQAREIGGTLEADMSGRKAGGGKVPVAWRLVEPDPASTE